MSEGGGLRKVSAWHPARAERGPYRPFSDTN